MSGPPQLDCPSGLPLVHDSAERHVSGMARYLDDIAVPASTLELALGLSTCARGRIRRLELDAVRAAEGVVAVFTAEDIPGCNDVSPVFGDDPLLASGEIHYHGQPVFAVAATSRLAARRAARLAVMDVEEETPILTIEAALSAAALLEEPYSIKTGDAAKAIAAAPHQLTGRLEIGGQDHFYLEGQAALALPGEADEIIIHASSQHPTEIQHKAAAVLGLPNHAVTVEVRRMGGGFGGKESQGNLPACMTALVAQLTGRPARLVYDRDDDMMITGKRHDFRIDYRVGFDDKGRILGLEADQALRCGYSYDLSQAIAERAMLHADNAYHLPNARITCYLCRTNTQSNTAFRGFGGPQGMVGMERVIDAIGHHLGCDPLLVRKANFYPDAATADKPMTTTRCHTPYGQLVEDGIIEALTSHLEASADYQARRAEIDRWNATEPVIRRGIALTPVKFGISFNKTFLNQAGALVLVYSDGSVQLNHGGTEMGQGLHTKIRQVVAGCFGIPAAAVKITATTTGKVPNTSATAASSGTDLNGMAAQSAAMTIRQRMAEHLARQHQADPDTVVFTDGRVQIGGNSISFAEAAHACWMGRVSLSATGFYATPKIGWDRASGKGRPFYYYAYGAAVSEVAVDTLTGENRLLRADLLHDVGHSINPAIDLGQIEGGFIQGAGWLSCEELVWADDGRLMTHAPSTYKVPACSDRPLDMRVNLYDGPPNREPTIHRSKAVGEPPLMLGISVLMAFSHALAGFCGSTAYPALDAPATPERLLLTLDRLATDAASTRE